MALGKKLKDLLDTRGITVKDFAKQINVAPTTLYSFIKRDSDTARFDLLAKICSGLDIEIDDFLDSKPTDEHINYAMKVITDSVKREKEKHLLSYFNDYTDEEIRKIMEYAEFVKTLRNTKTELTSNIENKKPDDLKNVSISLGEHKNNN